MAEQDGPVTGRALVALACQPSEAPPMRTVRRHAAFVAHLIAAARQMPQTRERRRVEPAEAIAAYRSCLGRVAN